jgi:hypothetical protein
MTRRTPWLILGALRVYYDRKKGGCSAKRCIPLFLKSLQADINQPISERFKPFQEFALLTAVFGSDVSAIEIHPALRVQRPRTAWGLLGHIDCFWLG